MNKIRLSFDYHYVIADSYLIKRLKFMYLKIKKVKTKTKSFENKTSQNWQKVFKFVKVCIRITLVHEDSRKIKVFGEFLKFFILAFLVCQRAVDICRQSKNYGYSRFSEFFLS